MSTRSAAATAWRRSRGGSRAVAAHSVTAAAAWRWRGSGGSLAAARRQRQRGGGAQRNGGGSLAAAAWRRRGGGGSAVTALSVIAARRRQLGGGSTVSADSIKAQMLHPMLTRVLGEPTHKQVKMVIRELIANLMAVSCPWGHNKEYLGLLQDPTIYLTCNRAAFIIPANEPPTYSIMSAGATVQAREKLRATNIAGCKHGQHTSSYWPSLATNLPPPLMTSMTPSSTIQRKDSTALTSAHSSNIK